jgi:hypothetical protein
MLSVNFFKLEPTPGILVVAETITAVHQEEEEERQQQDEQQTAQYLAVERMSDGSIGQFFQW